MKALPATYSFRLIKEIVIIFLLFGTYPFLQSQSTIVFNDNFNRSSTQLFFGGTPAMEWSTYSAVTPAGKIATHSDNGYTFQIYNSNTAANEGESGISYMTGSFTNFLPLFRHVLNQNSADVTWSFNIRNNNPHVNGLLEAGANNYAQLVILATTDLDLLGANAHGYAVSIVRESAGNGVYKLVKFTGGLSKTSNLQTLIESNQGLVAGQNFAGIKVIYQPDADRWSMYLRDDGGVAANDPLDDSYGEYISIGNKTENTFTDVQMSGCGFLYNHGITRTATSAKAMYDNFSVSIAIETRSKEIVPIDDTYVYGRGGKEPDAIRGLDDTNNLKTYFHDARTWAFETYLKFDLSAIVSNADYIENVSLNLYGNDDYGVEHTIRLFKMDGNVWDEDNLTYNSLPALGEKTWVTSMTANMENKQWYTWDITDLIKKSKMSGVNVITLMLCDSVQLKKSNGTTSVMTTFDSKENPSSFAPHLMVVEKNDTAVLLNDILIDGLSIDDFDPYHFGYTVVLPTATEEIPEITVVAKDEAAQINIVSASSLTGTEESRTTTITVSKSNQSVDYKVVFEKVPLNSIATLKGIRVDELGVEFYTPNQFNYTHYFPYTYDAGATVLIEVQKDNPNQTVDITLPQNLEGTVEERTAHITVRSGDQTTSKTYNIEFEILPKLDLYFLIGQSNMAGRGYFNEALGDFNPVENAYLFTPEYSWETAVNPMNRYSSRRKEISMQRISPAYGFAINLVNRVQQPIGLIVNAMGGSSMAQWTKGNAEGLYEAALIRALEAQRWGEFKAIVWHQGESNSGASSVPNYPNQLKTMVQNYRMDLNESDLYFVAGELAYWRGEGTGSTAFNNMIRTISSFIDNADYVSADGLTPLINESDPHFDRESNIELGKRYADKVFDFIYNKTAVENISNQKNQVYCIDGSVVVEKEFGETGSLLQIYDIAGNKIHQSYLFNSMRVDINKKGVYLVSLIGATETIHAKVMIN